MTSDKNLEYNDFFSNSEMDGLQSNDGIIVLGATTQKGYLDQALLRPGRFDTKVKVILPDIRGRRDILELFLSKVKYVSSIDIDKIAKMTNGFSGAELQILINKAAIRAAQLNKEHVTMAEVEYAKSRVRDEEDIRKEEMLKNMQRSHQKKEIVPEDIQVRFDDVKGCDKAKQELQDIAELLMNPEKISALGGSLPKGVLLSGKSIAWIKIGKSAF